MHHFMPFPKQIKLVETGAIDMSKIKMDKQVSNNFCALGDMLFCQHNGDWKKKSRYMLRYFRFKACGCPHS